MFHNHRWDGDFLTVKNLLDKGLLGDIRYCESHFDRYRPQVQQRWREQADIGGGIWYDLGPHLLDQAILLFGMPYHLTVDLAKLHPGANATDYFHAVLAYPQLWVVLHSTMLAGAESPCYVIHCLQGSYVKYGLDHQEDSLKAGKFPVQEDWGNDPRDGVATLQHGDAMIQQSLQTLSGNYPAYYSAVCSALTGKGDNPVTATPAIKVMKLIELGIESARHGVTLDVI